MCTNADVNNITSSGSIQTAKKDARMQQMQVIWLSEPTNRL
jgi:hypothetical protein